MDILVLHLLLLILVGMLPAKEVKAVAGHIATIKRQMVNFQSRKWMLLAKVGQAVAGQSLWKHVLALELVMVLLGLEWMLPAEEDKAVAGRISKGNRLNQLTFELAMLMATI